MIRRSPRSTRFPYTTLFRSGFGQGRHHALVVPIELHENEIPDLDVAIAFGFARSGRTARDPGPMVVENLAARTAGAPVGHLPEVIALVFRASRLVADADTALCHRHARRVGGTGLGVGRGEVGRRAGGRGTSHTESRHTLHPLRVECKNRPVLPHSSY